MEGQNSENEHQMVYSSQDILSSSAAGRGQTFFTRIKQKKSKPPKSTEPSKPRKRLPLTKRAKMIILLSGLGAIIIAGIIVITTLLLSRSSTDNSGEIREEDEAYAGSILSDESNDPEEVEAELYIMELNSDESVEQFNLKVNYLLSITKEDLYSDGTIDDLYQARIAEANDDNVRALLEISYAEFLTDRGNWESALDILNKFSEHENDLNLAIKSKLYSAYLYYYSITEGSQELYDEYNNKLIVVTEELYPPEEAEMDEGEVSEEEHEE